MRDNNRVHDHPFYCPNAYTVSGVNTTICMWPRLEVPFDNVAQCDLVALYPILYCWLLRIRLNAMFAVGDTKLFKIKTLDSQVHGANMGPIWGRQDPAGPHVGPMLAPWTLLSRTPSLGSYTYIWTIDDMIFCYVSYRQYKNTCNTWRFCL